MPKIVTIVGTSELLSHAETLGFTWNDACDFLEDIMPIYSPTIEIYADEISHGDEIYGWNEKLTKVLSSFVEKHNLKDFTIVSDK